MLLVGKAERMRPLGRPRRRWVDNIKMDLEELVWRGRVLPGLVLLSIGTSGDLL
jgi:hypothetical protein